MKTSEDDRSTLQSSAHSEWHASVSGARERLIALISAVRSERSAGGFTRDDGNVQFYTRVNALLSSNMTILDYGAGRGRQFDIPDPGYAETLQKFQGKVAKVVGIDVHEEIHKHPYLDERHVVAPGSSLPLAAHSVDLVIADWVLEHLEDPSQFASEMERVVRPGGWVCARTVNRWGYVGVGARLLPNSVHGSLVRKLIPVARTDDVFPVFYRANSLGDTRRWFSSKRWENFSYLANTTPRYFGNSKMLFRAIELYQKLAPYPLATDLFVFLKRK